MKAKGSIWGKKAVEKGTVWSDNIGGRVNDIAEKKFGTEHFWPVTGDFVREMDKCARILRAFTGKSIVQVFSSASLVIITATATVNEDLCNSLIRCDLSSGEENT